MQNLYKRLDEILEIKTLHSIVLKQLTGWRDEQRLVALGKPPDRKLQSIEKWYKVIAHCFTILEVQLPTFQALCKNRNFPEEWQTRIQNIIDEVHSLFQLKCSIPSNWFCLQSRICMFFLNLDRNSPTVNDKC